MFNRKVEPPTPLLLTKFFHPVHRYVRFHGLLQFSTLFTGPELFIEEFFFWGPSWPPTFFFFFFLFAIGHFYRTGGVVWVCCVVFVSVGVPFLTPLRLSNTTPPPHVVVGSRLTPPLFP